MRRSLFLVFLICFVFKLQGAEIPQEMHLSTETLDNGVKIWLQENKSPSHMVSLRIVSKSESDVVIDELECPYEPDEISSFLESLKEDKNFPLEDIGVIAVGDFDKTQMRELIRLQFSDINFWKEIKPKSAITLTALEGSKTASLKLSYPTPIKNLKTDEDLKNQWAVYFLQKLVEQELQESLKENGRGWADSSTVSSLVPRMACSGKIYFIGQDPVEMLVGFLMTIQDIKKNGFSDEKFKQFKAEVQNFLISMNSNSPDSNILASYYADQFVYGQKCPAYSFFIQTSLNLIAEMTLRDVHPLVEQFLKDNNRLVEMALVSSDSVSQDEISKALAYFGADKYMLTLEEDSPDDKGKAILSHALAYIQLPLKPEESKIIGEVIEAIGNHGWGWLAFHQGELRNKEQQIKHVHPMRFLGEIFSNTNLKACMRKVEKDSLIWSKFMKGLKPNMEKEFQRNNLLRHVEGFSQAVRADPEKVKIFVQKRDWAGLVKYLIQI